jgi:hypothetical protein
MYHFNSLTPISVFTNLFAVPLFSFLIMPICVFALILLPFGIAEPAFKLLDYLYLSLDNIAVFFSNFDFMWTVSAAPRYSLFLFSFAFYFFIAFKNKAIKYVCIFFMIFSFFTPLLHKTPDIMISAGGALVAAKKEDGRLQFFGKVSLNKYIANEWIKLNGQTDIKDNEKNYCARLDKCFYKTKGHTVYIMRNFIDLYENIKQYCEDEKGIIVTEFEMEYPACKAIIIDKPVMDSFGYVEF